MSKMTIDEVLTELGNREGYSRLGIFKSFPERDRMPTPQKQADLDFERWSNQTGLTKPELLNQIGAKVAIDYHEGRMSWEFGDMVINRLFKYTLDFKDANLFWEVFLAFDAGETTDVKIETTTDPQIAAIVARLRN